MRENMVEYNFGRVRHATEFMDYSPMEQTGLFLGHQ